MISEPTFVSNLSPRRYEGVVSYNNGHVKYAQYRSLPHNLNLKFSASPDRFNLESALLKLGSSAVTLHADVSNYSNPIADGDYQIQIHTQDFAAMSPQAAPAGDVLLTGKLHYQAIGNEPLLRNISINGRLASEVGCGCRFRQSRRVAKTAGNISIGSAAIWK